MENQGLFEVMFYFQIAQLVLILALVVFQVFILAKVRKIKEAVKA